ncbi:MAG TPA: hypothetical protein VFC44_10675 [Candidatus Saccharimonadales bacterium]|nr:hypothetical protein [Candidatus Saccharimonadales bacterium]
MQTTRSVQSSRFDPVYNISSIFAAHRDLRPYARLMLGDSGLSVEEADILVLLYGQRELEWEDCPVDEDGFVTFKDLKSILVHDPSLFARRIKKMAGAKTQLVEVKKVQKTSDPGLHGNSLRVRITGTGIVVARPIWENFRKLSATLFGSEPLKEFSAEQITTHAKINDAISRALREWRDPANRLL